jgi:hypothetical protein
VFPGNVARIRLQGDPRFTVRPFSENLLPYMQAYTAYRTGTQAKHKTPQLTCVSSLRHLSVGTDWTDDAG